MMVDWLRRVFSGTKDIAAQEIAEQQPLVPASTPEAPTKAVSQRGGGPPQGPSGSFMSFAFFLQIKIGNDFHIGYPKVPTRDSTTGIVRWGSALEWSWPDPAKARVLWVDDPHRGVGCRELANIEDILGAEGTISGKLIRFEQVLDAGKDQIVYSLYCPAEQFRMAYGLDRRVFGASLKQV